MKLFKEYLIAMGIAFMLLVHTSTYAFQTINVNTIQEIQNAMANAQPGDEIVIASGTYNFSNSDKIPGAFGRNCYLHSDKDGTEADPIILRGNSPDSKPVIEGVDYNDGYLLSLEGNYWIIKDIEFKTGSKGVILDNADHSQLINIEVHDVGDEAIHFRHGTTYSVADRCKVYDTGKKQPQYGEGLYVGSDASQHDMPYNDPSKRKYDPYCDFNTIQNCIIGPGVSAEHIDVKEGTRNTVIKNNTFYAEGITGANSADSFIDLKGMYGFVFDNVFDCKNAPKLTSVVDFSDRTGKIGGDGSHAEEKTGYRNAVFSNTINLVGRSGEIDTMKKASGQPQQTHMWNNTRNPASPDFPVTAYSEKYITKSCPDGWEGFEGCNPNTLGNEDFARLDFTLYPSPASTTLTIAGVQNLVNVSIYTIQGQKVYTLTDQKLQNQQFDVSGLASGTYLLRVNSRDGIGTRMFTKR